jgi:hypothetical protein
MQTCPNSGVSYANIVPSKLGSGNGMCVWGGVGNSKSKIYKIDVLNSNKIIIWTLIFEWFVVRCGPRTGHQKNMF